MTVFVAGCFNRIHGAHVRMLRVARSLGTRLVVILAHDQHNHKPNALPARMRLRNLRGLGIADKVRVGSPRGFSISLLQEKPDIVVLGYDQKLPDSDTERVIRNQGIEVIMLPWYAGKEDYSV